MRGLAVAAAMPLWAAAQVPGFGTDLTVHVVDEARKPVPQSFVITREFVNVPQFHGSRTYCERADIAPVEGSAHRARLPSAGMSHLTPGRTHALEAYAYAPGHCVERTSPGRAAAYSLGGPSMGAPPPTPAKPGSEVWLKARPVAANEERLHYLGSIADSLFCSEWSGRSRAELARMSHFMQAEADAIARTRYEKLLAQRMRERLAAASQLGAVVDDIPRLASLSTGHPYARDFLVAPANTAVRFPAPGDSSQLIVAARHGTSAVQAVAISPPVPGAASPPQTIVRVPPAPSPQETRLVIHCRHGAPSACDLDERDAQGMTALYNYVAALDAEAVKLLLDSGANPSVAVNLQGVDAIDALLSRAIMNPPAPASVEAGRATEIIDLLAASPKASIRASLADQLGAEPSQWLVQRPESVALLKEARVRLAKLPRRADPVRACEPIDPAPYDFAAAPVRLR